MTIVAYTDGACDFNKAGAKNKGGWGVLLFDDQRLKQPKRMQLIWGGENNTTNNRMEMIGAIQALANTPKDRPLLVKTDSQLVQKGVTEWSKKWRERNFEKVANADLWKIILDLCKDRDVTWQWVKGHSGVAGNEIADRLALMYIKHTKKSEQHNPHNQGKIAYELGYQFDDWSMNAILKNVLDNIGEYTQVNIKGIK